MTKFNLFFYFLQQEMVTRANQRLSTIGSLPPSALRSSKFDELMIDRSPKKSDKEVLSELERQLPNLPLGTIMEFHFYFRKQLQIEWLGNLDLLSLHPKTIFFSKWFPTNISTASVASWWPFHLRISWDKKLQNFNSL